MCLSSLVSRLSCCLCFSEIWIWYAYVWGYFVLFCSDIYPACCSLEVPGTVVCHLSLVLKIFKHCCFRYFSSFLSFFPCCLYYVYYIICNYPTVLGSYVLSFSFFFSLCVSVLKVSIVISSSSENFSLAILSLLMSPLKSVIHFYYGGVFFSPAFLFDFWVPLSLLTLLICSYMSSSFLLQPSSYYWW